MERLARHPRVSFWIVSGRRVSELRRHVKSRGTRFLGLHGWERDGPIPVSAQALRARLARARIRASNAFAGIAGIWVEDKEFAFVVHYRGAPARSVRTASKQLALVRRQLRGEFRVLHGKKMWEFLPREIRGKGFAVKRKIAKLRPPALPIYVGDDTTDEPAFAALRRGITVRVGDTRATHAAYCLRNPREVRAFLERVERELSR